MHFSTVARWKVQGWRPVAERTHPLTEAGLAIDAAAPVLTGDPAAAEALTASLAALVEQLSALPADEVLIKAARELCMTHIALCTQIQHQAAMLVGTKPAETAFLLQALTKALEAAVDAMQQAGKLRVSGRE